MKISRKEFMRLGLAGGAGLFLPFDLTGCGGLTAGNNSAEGSAGMLLKSAVRLPEPFTATCSVAELCHVDPAPSMATLPEEPLNCPIAALRLVNCPLALISSAPLPIWPITTAAPIETVAASAIWSVPSSWTNPP